MLSSYIIFGVSMFYKHCSLRYETSLLNIWTDADEMSLQMQVHQFELDL